MNTLKSVDDLTRLTPKEKLYFIRMKYGHEPIEPARQYCKHCGASFFTREIFERCGGSNEQTERK